MYEEEEDLGCLMVWAECMMMMSDEYLTESAASKATGESGAVT